MWSLIEVIYLVLYFLAGACFLAAALRRPPEPARRWDLIGLGLMLITVVKIIQLIDANT